MPVPHAGGYIDLVPPPRPPTQVATLLGVSSLDLLSRQQGHYASDTQKVETAAVLTIPCPGPKS